MSGGQIGRRQGTRRGSPARCLCFAEHRRHEHHGDDHITAISSREDKRMPSRASASVALTNPLLRKDRF